MSESTNESYALRQGHFFFPMKVVSRFGVGGKLDTTTLNEVVPGSVRVCEDGLDDALFTLRDDPADALIVNGRVVREPKVGVVNDPQGTDARNTEQPARADPAKGGPVQP